MVLPRGGRDDRLVGKPPVRHGAACVLWSDHECGRGMVLTIPSIGTGRHTLLWTWDGVSRTLCQ